MRLKNSSVSIWHKYKAEAWDTNMKQAVWCKNGEKRIYGELYLPKGRGPFPLVIYSHGYGYVIEEVSGRRLAKNGIAFYGFDFPGGSPGSRSDGSSGDMSVMTEAEDLEAVLDHFRADDRIDPDNIWLCGNSQGGFVSTVAGIRRQDDIQGLFLLCPAYIVQDFRKMYLGGNEVPDTFRFGNMTLGKRYVTDLDGYNVFEKMKRFEMPVRLYHGTADGMVPISYSERAARSFPNAILTKCPGAGHMISASGYGGLVEKDIIQEVTASEKISR